MVLRKSLRVSRGDLLARAIGLEPIEHRRSPPLHPQTNAMAEGCNGRIGEVLHSRHFAGGEDLKTTLMRNVHLCNTQPPQAALTARSPWQVMQGWPKLKPDLFKKPPYIPAGGDSQVFAYLIEKIGKADVSRLPQPDIYAAMEAIRHRIRFAIYIPTAVSMLSKLAIGKRWRLDNPAIGIEPLAMPKAKRTASGSGFWPLINTRCATGA